jgi:hypothetical protein
VLSAVVYGIFDKGVKNMLGHVGRLNSRSWVLGLAVALVCAAWAASVNAAARAEYAPSIVWPKTFYLQYLWDSTDYGEAELYGTPAILTLNRDKSVDVFDGGSGEFYPNIGTWRVRGNRIEFRFDGGVVYAGSLQPDNTYHGTMSAPSGLTGIWIGNY